MFERRDIENEAYRQYNSEEVNQLRKKLHLAESLNDFSIDQILACDTNFRIISCNRTCALTWDIQQENVIGKKIENAFPLLYSCESVREGLQQALKGFKVFVPSYNCSYSEGYYEHHFIPLLENNQTSGVLIIIHDIAHRIKAENELKLVNKELGKKNKELEQRNAEILSFSHVTGHDLKEPLRKIYLFLEMILKEEGGNFSKKAKSYFKRVQSSAQRMGLLTDDMLALAALDSNTIFEEVSLVEVLHKAKESLHEQMVTKNAVIVADNLPVIKGLEKMLFQLFYHLISNGIKFQEPGNIPLITITSSIEHGNIVNSREANVENSYLVISFTDNGIGLDTQYSEKIFQMFQRLNDAAAYPGTGIGLALCKKIVEIHNGFITVESLPGQGSNFRCYFPTTIS